MPDRSIVFAAGVEPEAGTLVQAGDHCRLEPGQVRGQLLGEEVVQAEATLVGVDRDHELDPLVEFCEDGGRVLPFEHGVAHRAGQLLEHRRQGQEPTMVI